VPSPVSNYTSAPSSSPGTYLNLPPSSHAPGSPPTSAPRYGVLEKIPSPSSGSRVSSESRPPFGGIAKSSSSGSRVSDHIYTNPPSGPPAAVGSRPMVGASASAAAPVYAVPAVVSPPARMVMKYGGPPPN
jgi:hypothetical protein